MKIKFLKLFAIQLALTLFIAGNASCQETVHKGKPTEEDRPISEFHTLHVSGMAEVYISRGETKEFKVIVSGMPAEDVITNNEGGVLTVTTKGNHSGESVKVYVSSPTLQSIEVSGAAKLYTSDVLKGEKLKILVSDAATAVLEVDVESLEIVMKGAGDLKVTGEAVHQQIRSYNSKGSLDNSGLKIQEL